MRAKQQHVCKEMNQYIRSIPTGNGSKFQHRMNNWSNPNNPVVILRFAILTPERLYR
jgi:hypothetical protein